MCSRHWDSTLNDSIPEPPYEPFDSLDGRSKEQLASEKTKESVKDNVQRPILLRRHLTTVLALALGIEYGPVEVAESWVKMAKVLISFETYLVDGLEIL